MRLSRGQGIVASIADSLPHLEKLVEGGELHLAVKATYLAGLIQDERAAFVLNEAAMSARLPFRLAAASTVRNFARSAAHAVLLRLMKDGGHIVRREALKSVRLNLTPEPRAHN